MNKDKSIFDLKDETDDEESCDEIILQLTPSNTIKINYFQLLKYSKLVRNEYTEEHIADLSEFLKQCQQKYKIKTENIISFFKNLNDEQFKIKENEYCDHKKLSMILNVPKYNIILKKFLKTHQNDVDFILILCVELMNQPDLADLIGEISVDMEDILCNNIEKCFLNQNFNNLPITQIYRIIEKSGEEINSNFLYDFIKKSFENRYILFRFMKIQKLSDQNFFDLCDKILKKDDSNMQCYVEYLCIDLNYIRELREYKIKFQGTETKIQNLENNNKKLIKENNDLQKENNDLRIELAQIKDQIEFDKKNHKPNFLMKEKNKKESSYENDNQSQSIKTFINENEEKNKKDELPDNFTVLSSINGQNAFPDKSEIIANKMIKKKDTPWSGFSSILDKNGSYDDSKNATQIPKQFCKTHKSQIHLPETKKENNDHVSKFDDQFTDI